MRLVCAAFKQKAQQSGFNDGETMFNGQKVSMIQCLVTMQINIPCEDTAALVLMPGFCRFCQL